ncbi:hypothetical protein [Cobetia marina]|uniref:hypothetical protein n=1 Tax=Cobetia marina TaxID=28258 RepID=UPI0036E1A078
MPAKIYFCDPYCSGQRGANENTNGLIRLYFPKGTDYRQVSNAELRDLVEKLNDYLPKNTSAIEHQRKYSWGVFRILGHRRCCTCYLSPKNILSCIEVEHYLWELLWISKV